MRWVLFLCLILPLANVADAACPMGPIQGIFYQPHAADLQLDSITWETRFRSLQRMQVKRLILQWTHYDEFDFIDARTSDDVDFLSLLGVLAQRNNIELHIGLASDPDWFDQAQRQDDAFEAYLELLRSDALAQAKQFLNLYPGLSFAGWYLPEEISDSDWQASANRELLRQHVSLIGADLRALKENVTLTVSAYASGAMSPDEYTSLLQSLLPTPGLRVLHQDGSGTRVLERDERHDYLRALSSELDNADWGVVVELFRQESLADETFEARPVEIEELIAQLDNRALIDSSMQLIGFSLRYLFDDDGQLIDEYLQHYCR